MPPVSILLRLANKCMNAIDRDIENMLRHYRERDLDLSQLRAWPDAEGACVEAQIPRGQWLKLKRGSEAQMNGAIARLLLACIHCLSVGEPKQFVPRLRFQQYSQPRDTAVTKSILSGITSPPFSFEEVASARSAIFYRCTQCHSIWSFVELQKEENGSWNKIAGRYMRRYRYRPPVRSQ